MIVINGVKGTFSSLHQDHPLNQRVYHFVEFDEDISLNGSEWVAEIIDELQLSHSYSDFDNKSFSDSLALFQLATAKLELPQSLSDNLNLSHNNTIAGGRLPVTIATSSQLSGSGKFLNNTLLGMAVYVDVLGDIGLAIANDQIKTQVAGIATVDVVAGTVEQFRTQGIIESSDWSTVTGNTTLSPGAYYYLSPVNPGQLTVIPPTATGQYVIAVGHAMSVSKLNIEIAQPVLL